MRTFRTIFTGLAIVLLCSVGAFAQTPGKTSQARTYVYDVSFTFKHDGQVIAKPYFVIESGKVADVSVGIGQEGTEPLSIQFSADEYVPKAQAAATSTKRAVLFSADVSQKKAGKDVVFAKPSASIYLDSPASFTVTGVDGAVIDMEVLVRPGNMKLAGQTKICGANAPAPKFDPTGMVAAQSNCCSAKCTNSSHTLRCCNVISCCEPICGACCSPGGSDCPTCPGYPEEP